MVCHAPGGSTDMNRCRSKLYPRRSSTSSILVFRLRDRPVMSRELAGEVSAPVDCTSPRGGAGAEEEQQRQRELLLALFGRSSSPPLFVELARGDEQARELSRVGPVGQLHPGGRRSAQVDGNRLLPGGRRAAQVDGNPLFSFLGPSPQAFGLG